MGTYKLKIGILVFFLFMGTAWAQEKEDDLTLSNSAFSHIVTDPVFTISITDEGQLEINGKAVDKMSDPEIKETMKKLRDFLENQARDRSLVRQYENQTEYLLRELGRCRKGEK